MGFAEVPEKHYRADIILERFHEAFTSAAKEVLAKYGCDAPTDFVIFYGELYGAIYPGMDCKSGLMPVQRGVYYSNDVHFKCFDIVVVRPSEKREVTDGHMLVNLWQESKKHVVLFSKNVESLEGRGNLEACFAKIGEEVSAGATNLTPTRDYIRKVLDGQSGNVMRDMPPCPDVVLAPHETMLGQTERSEICARHHVPYSEILFKGARDDAMAFSKATRCLPTTIAQQHGMSEPYTEREGNVVRTDLPIHVGERATLVVMKDKNPKFGEIARTKHSKGADDLKMEAPRFITRNRLDNVISKVELGTAAVALAQLLSKDALSDMTRKQQFVEAFSEQSEEGSDELQKILLTHSIALVACYKAERQEALVTCIACDGSCMLLRSFCPLCDGEAGF